MVEVREVLGHPSLRLVDLRTPNPRAQVRWVATSELADPTPFLEGGEILLTTGLNAAGWTQEWAEYVRRIRDAGVVAIGVGTGLTHHRVPVGLLDACRDHDLNVFEVPRATTFVAISRLTAQLIEQRQRAEAGQALVMQRELTQAALRRGDSSALLRKLAAIVHGDAVVLTAEGQRVASAVGSSGAGPDLSVLRDQVERIRAQGLRASSSTTGPEGATVVQPIGLRGRPGSYLAVWSPDRLNDGQRGAVTTAVALLSLAVENRNDRRETDRRLRRRAVELLVEGDLRTAQIVLGTVTGARSGRVPLPPMVTVVVASGSADELDDALASLEEHAGKVRPLVAARVEDELWLVAPARAAEPTAQSLVAMGLRVGVGSTARVEHTGRSRAAASHALAQTTDTTRLVRWAEIVDHGILALVGQEVAASFADTFLGPLSTRADLRATLQSFLLHHGSRGQVARDLGVHRNTVRKRIEEIEQAIGRSLDDPQVRVSAWVASQVEAARRLSE